MKISKSIFLVIFFTLTPIPTLSSPLAVVKSALSSVWDYTYDTYTDTVKPVISLGLKLYGIMATRVIVHEIGHALAAKIIYDAPFDIHLGIDHRRGQQSAPLIQLPGFAIHSFNFWKGGYACYKEPLHKSKLDVIKRASIIVAGPIAGLLGMGMAINFLKNNKDLREQHSLNSYVKSLFIHDVLYGFTPAMGHGSDGDTLWKTIGIDAEKRTFVARVLLAAVAFWAHCQVTQRR